MALLMSLILGSGLAAFTSNPALAQSYGYRKTTIHTTTTTAILTLHMEEIVIVHTPPTISPMSVKKVH